MVEYEDFSIKIEPQREDVYPVIVLRSPAGEGRSSFHLPFDPDNLGDWLVDLGQTVRGTGQRPMREAAPGATRTRPQQIGDQLFNSLFSGPVRSLLDQSLGMIRERQKGLRIKLHIDPEDASLARLASLPWELMYRKETRDFLNLSRYTPILRYLDVQVPYVPLKLEPPLRILVVISDPVDYARLDLEHERDQIERTWARQENVEVSFLERPTITALQERLEREPFHALHFMGHGGFDRRSGSGVLLLEDESRYGVPIDGRTLGVLLRDVPTLRLVFLNACETARVSKQVGLDPFAGVAAAIVMAGVPAVVAMQFPISDVAAIRFAGRFYPLIALGEPVDYAVAEGRRAIRLAESDTMEWATPILFMRAPDGVLFRVTETRGPKPPRRPPPILDKELEQRLEQLYIAGLSAFWLEEWDRACHNFQEIVDERPDYKDAAAKLQEAERKWHQNKLYSEAQEARQAGSWTMVLTRLEDLVAEDPGYKDSAALLDQARRQKRLADLYKQARQLHQAEQWLAVVRVFDQIAALDPDYPDPEGLLLTARHRAAELQRQAELNDLYRRAVLEMDAGHWEQAQQLLSRLQEQEPGYREADRLLAKVQAELSRQEAERQRHEQVAALYDRAANWAEAGQWAQALAVMDEIRALDSEFGDPQNIAARARAEVERQRNLEALYAQAQAAHDTQDWSQALAALQAVVDEDAGYRDAASLLAEVEKQQALATLYAQARQQHRAGEWQAVVETFARIAEIEPDYADPEGLLPATKRSLAEQQHRAELDDLYNRAAQAMEAGDWATARALLAQIREKEPGYRESAQLLAQAESELKQAQAKRQRQEQIATLYEQAQSLARARQWRPALAKMDEIHALDAGFTDPEGIAARARDRVAQEEAEARRQNELAALYAEAVRLLKADQFQEALQKWGEVQALDPRYPDRKKVQATARKKLDALAKPTAKHRLPGWASAAIGGLAVVVIVAAVVLLGNRLGGRIFMASPTDISTSTPPDIRSPSPVSDILSNARVTYHDSLDVPSLVDWTYETGVLQTADGLLRIQGVANRANQVRPKQDFYGGNAALVLFKYDAGANPYLFLETGEWETPTYKRWGIRADSYNSIFITEIREGTSWLDPNPLLGDNVTVSSTWYYLLLAVSQDGEFVAQVWQRDDPSKRAEYRHTFGLDWAGHAWTLVLQTDSGDLYVDSYTQIAFSRIVDSKASGGASPTTTTDVSCQSYTEWEEIKVPWLKINVEPDGAMTGAEEWSDAICLNMTLKEPSWTGGEAEISSRWWLKNDDRWLYLSARVPVAALKDGASASKYGAFIYYFWPEWSEVSGWPHSDAGSVNQDGDTTDSYGWDDERWYNDVEASPRGENNVEGALSEDTNYLWFEFRKALDSRDGYDWSWSRGQKIDMGSTILGMWGQTNTTWFIIDVKLYLASPQ
jgi:outer membrane protein assembly factor BamD (BamD/ComL family)